MKLTLADQDKALMYFSLCQALIQVIEDDWRGNPANRQRIKSVTNQQLVELQKVIEILLPPGDYSESGMKVTEQFVDATEAMLNFYRLGVQLSRMDDVKREGFSTQMKILMKNYGIDFEL
jgi:BMFP domain-containing protein YqiC